jgi:CRP-like cAMP-binding protein
MEERLLTSRLHSLLKTGKKQTFTKGQVFQHSHDRQHFVLLESGFVKRYSITSKGSLGVQIIYGKNDVFPLTHVYKLLFEQFIYKGQEVYYYETMSRTELYSFDNIAFKQAVEKDPSLYKDLFSEAGRRLESNIQRLENLSLPSSYHQVAHQLHHFAMKFGKSIKEGIQLDMPLTQQDLADILGASRETISTAMTKLQALAL